MRDKTALRFGIGVLLVLAVGIAWWHRSSNLENYEGREGIPHVSQGLRALPKISTPTEISKNSIGIQATASPQPKAQGDDSLVDAESIEEIGRIIKKSGEDLTDGIYGPPGELSFNIVYLFRESLMAFHRYLKSPQDGPSLNVLFGRSFIGKYRPNSEDIELGRFTLNSGEGAYLEALFHEYQHYLYHTIYGTPAQGDIARRFYNEIAAYLFDRLLSYYLPETYFASGHHSALTRITEASIRLGRSREAMSNILHLMEQKNVGENPMYPFLIPVQKGELSEEELLGSIDETFNVNGRRAAQIMAESHP